MGHTVLLMSIGPGAAELDRLRDFLAALFYWEPSVRSVVFIDDALESRSLEKQFSFPDGVRVNSISHPRKGKGEGVWGALAEGVLLGLDWIAAHEPHAAMVLKIDTDALVIGPFADRANSFFSSCSEVGLTGLHDRHCSGEPRSFWPWNRAMFNYALPIGTRRQPSGGRRLRWQLFNAFGRQRRILRRARKNGYAWGEHCLGGAYMLKAETIRDMRRQGLFVEADFWRSSMVGEDVVVAAYVKAAGWQIGGYAAAGEIFGIEYTGLPFSPEELEARQYSVIHSIKNYPPLSEEQIRRFFQARRGHS